MIQFLEIMKSKKKFIFKITFTLLILLLVFNFVKFVENEELLDGEKSPSQVKLIVNNEKSAMNPHIKIYDLNKSNRYNFECVNATKIIVSTLICIHDVQRDIYVSGAIKNVGVWEYSLVRQFMHLLNSSPNISFLGKIE